MDRVFERKQASLEAELLNWLCALDNLKRGVIMNNELILSAFNQVQFGKIHRQASLALDLIEEDDATRFANILRGLDSQIVFDYFSNNSQVDWTIDLIERYKDQWNWSYLNYSRAIPWTIELIEKYKTKLYTREISSNESLPWSVDFIEKYKDKFHWESLSSNNALPWSIDFLEKYADKWDWFNLSTNKSLPWSVELIEKFINRWDWGVFH